MSDDAWATRFDEDDPVHRAVDELVSTALADGGYVGVAAALVEDGRTVLARGWGRTSAGDGAGEVSPGTLFAFGSISKTLTALLVLRLREQGCSTSTRRWSSTCPTSRSATTPREDVGSPCGTC